MVICSPLVRRLRAAYGKPSGVTGCRRPSRLVFAPKEWAEPVARIHQACESSAIWGEFRSALTEEEFATALEANDWEPEDLDPSAAFPPTSCPATPNGPYPDWLRRRALEWFPNDLIEKYGDTELSVHDGEFFDLPVARAAEIADDLRALGHTVERSELYFY